jgi:hypothetical protein
MLPVLTNPLALIGLAAVPALVAIYLLRHRFRRQPVSSLMLWRDMPLKKMGGTRIRWLHLPWLFFLELLLILLLVLAAVDPLFRLHTGTRPLVIILDDSFSMLAGGDESPRQLAIAALREELRRRPASSVRFVLAGDQPRVLGLARTTSEAREALSLWRCRAPRSCLEEAIPFASELGGEVALLLVVTDRAPPKGVVPEHGRLAWWAFGQPRPNVAFVAAARTAGDEGDRVLLEVANLSPSPHSTALTIKAGTQERVLLELAAGETRRIIRQLGANAPTLHAHLEGEPAIDNKVSLPPAVRKLVRAEVRVEDKKLRALLDRAIDATKRATRGPEADIVFTDRVNEDVPAAAWAVRFVAEPGATAYKGPFVLDRAHPLTDGLSLRAVVWGAGKGKEIEGAPVVMAGNVVLLADLAGADGRHELRWRFDPMHSTLQYSTDWPVLIWNVLEWRGQHAPGLSRSSVRLGEALTVTLPSPRDEVQVVTPSGEEIALPVQGKQVAIRAEDVGTYEVRAGDVTYSFACNALRPEESDMTGCSSGRWGDWLDDTTRRLELRSVAWAVLLVVLGLTVLHLFLVAREARGRP